MKTVTDHQTPEGINSLLRIEVADEPVKGDSDFGRRRGRKYAFHLKGQGGWSPAGRIEFHDGPLGEQEDGRTFHPQGVSVESVLAVLIDRLDNEALANKQKNKPAFREVAALHNLRRAMDVLLGTKTEGEIEKSVGNQ